MRKSWSVLYATGPMIEGPVRFSMLESLICEDILAGGMLKSAQLSKQIRVGLMLT